jgi:glycogen debranching enzyme
MTAPPGPPTEPPLLSTSVPLPGQPILVAGGAAAAILSADGTFSLRWDTRGAPLEWGGVYAQGVRLCGPWAVAVGSSAGVVPLGPGTLRSLRHWRWGVESTHAVPGLAVVDEVLSLPDVPGVARRVTVRSADGSAPVVRIETELPLSLAPVLIEGVSPHEYELTTRQTRLKATAHGSAFALESDPLPSQMSVDGANWIGGRRSGDAKSIRIAYDLPTSPNGSGVLAWSLWGGLEATVEGTPDAGQQILDRRAHWRPDAELPWRQWASRVPQLETPDDPGLAEGFRLATGALRALYTDPEPGMCGLVAGYPWYSALWFRDIAWMLPAVLWMGDVDRVVGALATAFRFQAPNDLSLLGGTTGELPMQLSPGPIFLYGTSDTTLYYPGIVRRLVRHTGDPDRAKPYRTALARILSWGDDKVDRETGLFTNGGEVAAMKTASGEVGRVHYGIEAYDTTIWDSADRRNHAVDLQALWSECLEALADLEELAGGRAGRDLRARATAAKSTILEPYHWPEEGYLYDSILRDGTKRAKIRPNALRAVELGLLGGAEAATACDRAAEDDLTTPWGVRTLSARDPTYDPQAYHEGQVWSIATAWSAAAAFRLGRADAGVRYLDVLAGHLRTEHGYANECYRGDRPEPFDSCFLLGFSVAPFLTSVFEGLWGLTPMLHRGTVRCRPNFPRTWHSACLRGVRLGPGSLDLAWVPGAVTARWSGPGILTLEGEQGSVQLAPGVPTALVVSPLAPPS